MLKWVLLAILLLCFLDLLRLPVAVDRLLMAVAAIVILGRVLNSPKS